MIQLLCAVSSQVVPMGSDGRGDWQPCCLTNASFKAKKHVIVKNVLAWRPQVPLPEPGHVSLAGVARQAWGARPCPDVRCPQGVLGPHSTLTQHCGPCLIDYHLTHKISC